MQGHFLSDIEVSLEDRFYCNCLQIINMYKTLVLSYKSEEGLYHLFDFIYFTQ